MCMPRRVAHISDKLNGIHLNEYFLHVSPLMRCEHVAVVAEVVKEKHTKIGNFHRKVCGRVIFQYPRFPHIFVYTYIF